MQGAVFTVLVFFVWVVDKKLSQVLRLREERLVLLLLLRLLGQFETVLQVETLPVLLHLNLVLTSLLGLYLVGCEGPPLGVTAWRGEGVFEAEAFSGALGRSAAEVALT